MFAVSDWRPTVSGSSDRHLELSRPNDNLPSVHIFTTSSCVFYLKWKTTHRTELDWTLCRIEQKQSWCTEMKSKPSTSGRENSLFGSDAERRRQKSLLKPSEVLDSSRHMTGLDLRRKDNCWKKKLDHEDMFVNANSLF
jgi:hypothetical protein